ncbi:hypothetical protein UVI_02001950 [Ustilaginoidea virens]|uniref:Thioesterase domain-containing protein n=1 Tax=Ustilaginoidea virens TaxID=1159556 RepID=A0A1B5L3G8_USTVR|nr:hypothetical protein UVI_02001950 [Ustilaginoidea virens]
MANKLSPTSFTRANRLGTIHGGTLASLVDLGGSLAVASTGRFKTGVSTDLNVTYLAPGGAPGDTLKATAVCEKSRYTATPAVKSIHGAQTDVAAVGKTLAFTTVTFTNSKGQVAARGSHTKYVTGTMGADGPFVAPAEYAEDVE